MKPRTLLAALLFAFAGQLARADAQSVVAIRDLEQAQARAAIARDRDALSRLFAPDFRIINPSGAVTDRDGLFAVLLGSTAAYRSAIYETQQISDYGDTVVTTGLETVVMAAGAQAGQTVKRRITQVWHRETAGWQLKVRHATIMQ